MTALGWSGVNKAGSYGLRSMQEVSIEIGGTLRYLVSRPKGVHNRSKSTDYDWERGRSMIKYCLSIDHEMVRMGVIGIFIDTSQISEVVGEAENGRKYQN